MIRYVAGLPYYGYDLRWSPDWIWSDLTLLSSILLTMDDSVVITKPPRSLKRLRSHNDLIFSTFTHASFILLLMINEWQTNPNVCKGGSHCHTSTTPRGVDDEEFPFLHRRVKNTTEHSFQSSFPISDWDISTVRYRLRSKLITIFHLFALFIKITCHYTFSRSRPIWKTSSH